MNQNPTASTSASAEGIAQDLSSLSPAAVDMFSPVADKQWAWRKSRPTCFGDHKHYPRFSNGVNADTKPTEDQKLQAQAAALAEGDPREVEDAPSAGTVPTVEAEGSEPGPVEVQALPDSQ